MATLEFIEFQSERPQIAGSAVEWIASRSTLQNLPVICWENGDTWSEANLWAFEEATSKDKNIKTVNSAMSGLLSYAKWLEAEGVEWWHFPAKEKERCLNRYRGELIRARDSGLLAPSTASARMATVIRFYRWLKQNNLLCSEWPMWADRQIGIRITDTFGFEHTLRVLSTDLAIPNRRVAGAVRLEDGLLPISPRSMRAILEFADEKASVELALMLRIGFGTGLRIGSICDLKVETLLNARLQDQAWHWLQVGPGARPPVATKLGVTGSVPVSKELLNRALEYAASTRRLKRQGKAKAGIHDNLFLTRLGAAYGSDSSRAVNVELGRLRKAGLAAGVDAFLGFHFHRSRATFITELMRAALKYMPVGDAITFVRRAALHRADATTLAYVKFIHTTKAMAEAADAFTRDFMGLAEGARSG